MPMDTMWIQCYTWLQYLKRLQGKEHEEIDIEEVNRLAVLVTQELTVNIQPIVMNLTQDPDNGFDDPIPF